MLVGDLVDPMYIVNPGDRKDRVDLIVKYFKESTMGHGVYAFKFFACELFCLVNVIAQVYITDRSVNIFIPLENPPHHQTLR